MISSSQLEAFYAVAQLKNFSKAASKLFITQPALSQRVLNLEESLNTSLFIREPSGVRLTDDGESLLRYCQQLGVLEQDFLSQLSTKSQKALSGTIRIGGFSSIARSAIIPALDPVLRGAADLQLDLQSAELGELAPMLRSGAVDYVLHIEAISSQGVVSELLGYEKYVLAKSAKYEATDMYLDHDADDKTTISFLAQQGQKKSRIKRSYLDDVYGIIDGVERGWGVAVLPEHLILNNKHIAVVSGKKPLYIPVYLNYYEQPYYTALQKLVLQSLRTGFSQVLSKGPR